MLLFCVHIWTNSACWSLLLCVHSLMECLHLQSVLNVNRFTEAGPGSETRDTFVTFTLAKGPKLFSTLVFSRGLMPPPA